MKKAQVGFIGVGAFISGHHLLTVRDSEIMDIRAIADLDEAKLADYSGRMTVGYTTTDYKKILADREVDIVIIGTRQDMHAGLIVEALEAGKWVFCEKPMSETDEQTAAVLAAEKRCAGKLAIGFNRRFAPACAETKRLMQSVPRPWYINYRLMYPNPGKDVGYYHGKERILFEGCHILDLVCWMLEAAPRRVFMTGDRIRNNCCILDYADGSQVSFVCGSMGSYCLWKEYMEVFGYYTAITVSDFVDMRVRGFEGEFDRVYRPYLDEYGDEVEKYGFDFYERYKVKRYDRPKDSLDDVGDMAIERVQRPVANDFPEPVWDPRDLDYPYISPDKGWQQSLEHFARCFLEGKEPDNADGAGGALATDLAMALLKSLETGQVVEFGQ